MIDNMMKNTLGKVLNSDAVRGALSRTTGRYAEIVSLGFLRDAEGLEAVLLIHGFSEQVRVVLRRAEIAGDGSWIIPLDIEADREGVDALLKDLIQGRRFSIAEKARMYTGMLRKVLPE